MNKLNAFLQDRYDMKTFNHVSLTTKLPDISTETIKGKRFYITPEGKKYPSITKAAEAYGLKSGTVRKRINQGKSIDEAFYLSK